MKQFVFLYPTDNFFNQEIENGFRRVDMSKEEYKELYAMTLNSCIDMRYRQEGYTIHYALFTDEEVSSIVNVALTDNIFTVGMNYSTHITKQEDKTHPYPDNQYILSELGTISTLRVAGFHMWDCVEKLAKHAYEKNIDVLVDEDLTEFLGSRMFDKNFQFNTYPTYNPKDKGDMHYESFMQAREERPWLWQNY